MLSVLFTTVFLVGTALGSPLANQYVESVLNTVLRNEIRNLNLDPAAVPDFVTNFEDKVAIIGKVKGKAEYSKGTLAGLSEVRRFTECQGPYYSFGVKSINCTLAFDNLKLKYEGKVKYGKMPKIKMLSVLITTVFLVGSALGSPFANQYVESVLNTVLRNEIRYLNLDPAAVPDFITNFVDKVPIIGKVKGTAEFSKGTLTGLSGVRRFTECQGPYYSFGAKRINCTLAFDRLKLDYEGKVKYGKVPKVNIKGKANVTSTLVFIEVSSIPGNPATVNNFLFSQIGKLDVKFTGLGPLNRFTKFLEDGYKAHVQAEIFNSMSLRFQAALGRAFSQVPMPN